jgi:hypothetical protein
MRCWLIRKLFNECLSSSQVYLASGEIWGCFVRWSRDREGSGLTGLKVHRIPKPFSLNWKLRNSFLPISRRQRLVRRHFILEGTTPILVAALCKAHTVLGHSNTGIVSSIPALLRCAVHLILSCVGNLLTLRCQSSKFILNCTAKKKEKNTKNKYYIACLKCFPT